MPIRLIESTAIQQSYINVIPGSIADVSKYLAILDDPLLCSSHHGHLKYLDLLKALPMNGLKISPKNCQLSEN